MFLANKEDIMFEDEKKKWEDQLKETVNQLNNRKFEYDVNADALYQQYKNIYNEQGKKAMEDTIGQASALTGGYASSYAQTAGQEALNDYMKGLDYLAPELYKTAKEQYDLEGEELTKRYEYLRELLGGEGVLATDDITLSDDVVKNLESIKDNDTLAVTLDKMVENKEISESKADELYAQYVDKNEAYSTTKEGNSEANYLMMFRRAMNSDDGAGWSLTSDGDIEAPDGSVLSRKQWSKLLQSYGVDKSQARKSTKDLLEKLESLK